MQWTKTMAQQVKKNGAKHSIVSKDSDVTKCIAHVVWINCYGVGNCALLLVYVIGYFLTFTYIHK